MRKNRGRQFTYVHHYAGGPRSRSNRSAYIGFGYLGLGLGVALLGLFVVGRQYFITGDQYQRFAEATKLFQSGQFQQSQEVVRTVKPGARLSPWVDLLQAQLHERLGDKEAAFALYLNTANTTSTTSAAGLEATVAALRLGETLGPPVSDSLAEKDLDQLQQSLTHLERKDLLPELMLARALRTAREGEQRDALAQLVELRTRFPKSPLITAARLEYDKLSGELPLDGEALGAAKIAEAVLLQKEGDPQLGLARISDAKALTDAHSKRYFELQLVEEQLLRKLKRNEEADNILHVVATEGAVGVADEALLRTARNDWNINNHVHALETINELATRFRTSQLLNEAYYIKGRILEEIGSLDEARQTYKQLASDVSDYAQRLRAYRRLAWIDLRSGQYSTATEQFSKLAATATDTLDAHLNNGSSVFSAAEPKLPKPLSTDPTASAVTALSSAEVIALKDEIAHAQFWEGYAHSKRNDDSTARTKAIELWQALENNTATRYYRLLAKRFLKDLGVEQPYISGTDNSNLEIPASSCSTTQELPADLLEFLESLQRVGDTIVVRKEIAWSIAQQSSLSEVATNAEKFSTDAMARINLESALLLARFADQASAIQAAKRALNIAPDNWVCAGVANRLLFPVPLRDTFLSAARTYRITAALTMAIARTESYFDAKALSSAGAMGIMQLMSATAKQEGLKDGEDLYNPETNISLGTKHLARLLRDYENEEGYAIAAYNAGTAAVNNWRSRSGSIPVEMWIELIGYPETYRYVKDVLAAKAEYATLL